jgi:hypothetical protein
VSTERVELLVLGSTQDEANKLPLDQLIKQHSAYPLILPWGFGKWLGKRRTLIAKCLKNASLNQYLWIGDSALRPKIWRSRFVFNIAKENGVPHLSGSDPLPLKGQEGRIGRLGGGISFLTDQPFQVTSTSDILSVLKDSRLVNNSLATSTEVFGSVANSVYALTLQIRLRIGI